MASNFTDIEIALIQAVETLDAATPKGYPNKQLKDPPNSLWLAMHNMRANSRPVTLGDAGEDNHDGIFQIDINVPESEGSGNATNKADVFASFFTAGRALVYNGQNVRVISSSLSPGRYVGGYYRLSLNVRYYARTVRS